MKIFLSAVIVLALCAVLVISAQSYILASADELRSMTEGLPQVLPEGENAPDSIIGSINSSVEFWRSRRPRLCTAISHREFDEIENLLIALDAAARSGDRGNYALGIAELRERLDKLSDSEKLSLGSIF